MIRHADHADAASFARVISESQTDWKYWEDVSSVTPCDTANLIERCETQLVDADTVVLCFEQDGTVVAIAAAGPEAASFKPSDTSDRNAHLSGLFVHQSEHGAGIAQRLHDQLLVELAAQEFRTIRLWVPSEAAQARHFYVRNQWRETGTRVVVAGLELIEMRRPTGLLMNLGVVEVTSRLPSEEAAQRIADELLASRLCAAAHMTGPFRSSSLYEGAVEQVSEWELNVITVESLADQCTIMILDSHPHLIPALTSARGDTTVGYSAWVREATGTH